MAQGFKRTGNAVSTNKKSSATAVEKRMKNFIRKGARVIAPKKTSAASRINLTNKLTSQVNRRAESALITRLGINTESSFKLVRPDAQLTEEVKDKKGSKKESAGGSKSADKNDPATTLKNDKINSISRAALDKLNSETIEAENKYESASEQESSAEEQEQEKN